MAGKEFSFGFSINANLSANFNAVFGVAGKKVQALNADMKKLKEQQKMLEKADREGVVTKNTLNNALTQLKSRYEKLETAQKKYLAIQGKINKLQSNMSSHASNALQFSGMAWSIAKTAQAAVTFESAMADVKKVVDFDTPDQFKAMGKDILDLSTRIPIAAEGLAQIVAAGGQSGIARDELLGFAESAAKMGVAFDITADQAGDMMAKWRTAFKMGQSDVVALADKINYLGNTTAASAPLISDVVTRIGPLGSIGGVASGEIAALGASMVGAGINSEIAATGIKNMILSLVSGSGATKTQANAFASLGLNAVQMAEYMQKDAKGAILTVLKSIQQLDKAQQASTLQALFGKESLGAISPLLSNLEGLEENFDKVADAAKYAGSMEAEFAARSATAENAMKLMENSVRKAQVAIGNGLLPAIAPVTAVVSRAAVEVGNFAAEYPNLTGAVLGGTGVVFAGAAAVSALMWAYSGLRLAVIGTKNAYILSKTALLGLNAATKLNTVATKGLALAQLAFNSVLAACRALVQREETSNSFIRACCKILEKFIPCSCASVSSQRGMLRVFLTALVS